MAFLNLMLHILWECRTRYSLSEKCTITDIEGKSQGWVTNLSECGAFVVCMEPLEIGEKVRLRFKVNGTPVVVTGRVVHQLGARRGYGVRLEHVPATHRKLIYVTQSLRNMQGGIHSRGGNAWGYWLARLLKRSGRALFADLSLMRKDDAPAALLLLPPDADVHKHHSERNSA